MVAIADTPHLIGRDRPTTDAGLWTVAFSPALMVAALSASLMVRRHTA